MQTTKNILVCPLDWGLGHATRCIPILNALIEQNYTPIIGGNGRSYKLLQNEFPQLDFVEIPGYDIVYPKSGGMIIKIATQIPKIISGIKREQEWLKEFLKSHKVDGIISDNRFGLYAKGIPTVYISHQVLIKSPFAEKSLHKTHARYINKFTELWIPDVEGENNLSGDLGHKYQLPNNAKFVGPLSRFKPSTSSRPIKYDVTAILSGPEPQRSILEEIIKIQLKSLGKNCLLVRGITEGNTEYKSDGEINIVDYLKADELGKVIHQSEIIVSRAGYSTIMDLASLSKKAILIPTPGQTEQEYLAKMLHDKKICFTVNQNKLNLKTAIKESKKYAGFAKLDANQNWEKLFSLFKGK